MDLIFGAVCKQGVLTL